MDGFLAESNIVGEGSVYRESFIYCVGPSVDGQGLRGVGRFVVVADSPFVSHLPDQVCGFRDQDSVEPVFSFVGFAVAFEVGEAAAEYVA